MLQRLQKKMRSAGSAGGVSDEAPPRSAGAVRVNASASVGEPEIAVRAYERWMGRGAPASDGVEDWLAARQELESELVARKPAAKPKTSRARKSVH